MRLVHGKIFSKAMTAKRVFCTAKHQDKSINHDIEIRITQKIFIKSI